MSQDRKIENKSKNRYSYSRVQTFKNCKAQFFIRYILEYSEEKETDYQDALLLGKALHKGMELREPKAASEYYLKHFNIQSDIALNEAYKLETLVEQGLEIVPAGLSEIEIKTDMFLGYVDLITDNAIFDYKYCNPNKLERYTGEQLNIYRSMLGNNEIKHLYYVIFPKLYIRQKKTESVMEFRKRMKESLGKPFLKEVEVDNDIIKTFFQDIDKIENCTNYPKTKNLNICRWCSYKKLCDKEDNVMNLPKAIRKEPENNNNINIWVYGKPDSGKTHFANTAKMPLMLNTDGNAKLFNAPKLLIKDYVREGAGGIVNRTTAWEAFTKTIEELEKNKDTGYDTIVIDLLEDVFEAARADILKKNKWDYESDAGFGKGWDMVRKPFLDTMKKVANLPYNIVFISHLDNSHETTKMTGESVTDIAPNINSKIANKIAGMCDFTCAVYDRKLHFNSDNATFGVTRRPVKNKTCDNTWQALLDNIKKGE